MQAERAELFAPLEQLAKACSSVSKLGVVNAIILQENGVKLVFGYIDAKIGGVHMMITVVWTLRAAAIDHPCEYSLWADRPQLRYGPVLTVAKIGSGGSSLRQDLRP